MYAFVIVFICCSLSGSVTSGIENETMKTKEEKQEFTNHESLIQYHERSVVEQQHQQYCGDDVDELKFDSKSLPIGNSSGMPRVGLKRM
mmetsp:Transcript_21135/g.49917  ORF Transcript_21135/g.49917 Transcript_21135/m.49917 type:complete len:89 (-) Transcript_21135:1503-1769(-)